MKEPRITAGFMGAGGIARAHAFSLKALRYYYDEAPLVEFEAVCSATKESRESFAMKYGFREAVSPEEFITNEKIDTVFILGPNKVHFEHLKSAVAMPSVKSIYLEKPVCSTHEEAQAMSKLISEYPRIKIQVGFQFLFSASIREALKFWRSGKIGRPVHFEVKYYHGDYLKKEYREKRVTRLAPCPDGGAMADLGSHAISILIAFLGNKIRITGAIQAGNFEDVPPDSDLFSMITIADDHAKCAGTLAASRVSSGTGDLITLDIFAEKGTLRYSTATPDFFEYFLEETGAWNRIMTGSNYRPLTSFPSGHVPPGWLRSMIHAHYFFLTGKDNDSYIPDIQHGLDVQRIVTQTADHLKYFRSQTGI